MTDIKPTKLKTYPKTLPPTSEVRDFILPGGKFARVIMELSKVIQNQGTGSDIEPVVHWAISAQCYEMDKAGNFKQASNGYPSRSGSTTHTMPGSALGVTLKIDDGWVRLSMDVDPKDPPVRVTLIKKDPDDLKDVAEYGTIRHNTVLARTWQFVQGWADQIAQLKVEELVRVLSSSTVHSGLGFRKQQ